MHSDLYSNISAGEIDGCVSHSAQKKNVKLFDGFESTVEVQSLLFANSTVNERFI